MYKINIPNSKTSRERPRYFYNNKIVLKRIETHDPKIYILVMKCCIGTEEARGSM